MSEFSLRSWATQLGVPLIDRAPPLDGILKQQLSLPYNYHTVSCLCSTDCPIASSGNKPDVHMQPLVPVNQCIYACICAVCVSNKLVK